MLCSISAATAGGGGSPPAAPAADAKPVPDTDPGGHRALIWAHAFTPTGQSIVSVSSDRTMRIWSTETGEQRVVRGMRGEGNVGKLFALAVSPDGALAAVGGALGPTVADRGDIRLIDLTSGDQIGRLTGHTGWVRSLTMSKDGQWLASGDDKGAVKIWSMTTRREVAHIDNAIEGTSKAIWRLAFPDPDHLVATAYDGLRVFKRAPLTLERFVKSEKPETALAVSGDGTRIATAGDDGVVRIRAWPAVDELQWTIPTWRRVADLAFGAGPSATRLAVASGKEPYVVTVWDVASKTQTAAYEGHDNVVQGVAVSPDGTQIASVGGNANAIHLWSLTEAEQKKAPIKASRLLQGGGRTVWSVGFLQTPDNAKAAGTYLAWGYSDPCVGTQACPDVMGPLSHAIRLPDERLPTLGDPFPLKQAPWLDEKGTGITPIETRALLRTPTGSLRGEKQATTRDNLSRLLVERNGESTEISKRSNKNGTEYYSFSFDPSGSWIVSGGRNNMLETLTLDGKQIKKLDGHDGDVPAVAVSPDGRFIASGSIDQTVRLWNSKTGELIASLLHLPDDDRWIMWTPQGYFGAAPAGENLIGWHIDRGPDKSADFVTAGEVRTFFHNRELVARAIVLASSEAAVSEFRAAGSLPNFSLEDLQKRSPPDLRVREPRSPFDPNAPVRTKNGRVNVVLDLLDNTADIERFEVWVNGNQVVDIPTADATDAARRRATLEVPLFAGYNNIIIMPITKTRPQRDWRVPVILDASTGPLDFRDKAYILAIGVNGYNPPTRALQFARDDATEFALAMEGLLRNNHKSVHPIVLVDNPRLDKLDVRRFDVREPTHANIVKALGAFSQAGPNDTIVLFLAGHGTNRTAHASGFVFLPLDANKDANGYTEASTVPWSTFQSALDAGNGRKIVFLDACRSSHVFDYGVTNYMVSRNLAVYSSTGPLQDARESPPHGYFTEAVLLGLSGKANRRNPAVLQFEELGRFVADQVIERTGNQQTPRHFMPPAMPEFAVVRYCTPALPCATSQ